jgi:uncharacterized protein involved in exopolysaccharide biosynthesis
MNNLNRMTKVGSNGRPSSTEVAADAVHGAQDSTGSDPLGVLVSRDFYSIRDLLSIAAYHRRIALGGLLTGLMAGLIALLFSSTQYTASALLIVLIGRESASPQDVVGIGPNSLSVDGLKVLQSEISIIESVDVIERALTVVGPTKVFPELASSRLFGLLPYRPPEQTLARAADLLRRRMLAADSQNSSNNGLFNGSNIMRVSLSLPDRAIAISVLNALVAAYLERRGQLYASPGGAFLRSELENVEAQLRALETRIQRARTEFGVLDIAQDISLATSRLDAMLARESSVRERQRVVNAELASANQQLRQLPGRVFDSRDQTNQPPNDDTRNTLLKLQLERAHLAEQYAPTWPALVEVDRKIAAIQSMQASDQQRPLSFTQRDIRNPSADILNSRVVQLEVERRSLETQIGELAREIDRGKARVAELRLADGTLHDLERQRGVQENVQRQIALREANVRMQDTITAARNANVNVVQPASAPFVGSNMGLSYLAAFTFAGLMAGLAGALAAARLRQVFVVPREAERVLALESLAEFDAADRSFASAQGRRVRANLAASLVDDTLARRRMPGRSVTLLQVAGLDEASTRMMAQALAGEFAETHGLRTLLVDVNMPVAGLVAQAPGDALKLVASGTRNLWSAPDAAAALLRGRSDDLPAAIVNAADIVVVVSAGTGRDHAVRRIASLADASLLVVVAERTQSRSAADLVASVLAAGGRMAGFVFTGRRAALPGFVMQWL